MPVTWIVQKRSNYKVSDSVDGVAMVLANLEIPFVRYEHNTMFSDEFFNLNIVSPKIYYGSTGLCRLAEVHDPEGLFFDVEKFKTSTWCNNRDDILNDDAVVLSAKEAMVWIKNNSIIKDGQSIFLRPNNDLKTFSGMMMEKKQLISWLEDCMDGKFSFNEDLEIVLAPHKKILFEIRCFVVNHEIVDASIYKHRDRTYQENLNRTRLILPQFKDEFLSKLNEMAKKWMPHEIVVMDVCVLDNPENDMKVVEFNCFNGTGFYDNNVPVIVKTITDYLNMKYSIQKNQNLKP